MAVIAVTGAAFAGENIKVIILQAAPIYEDFVWGSLACEQRAGAPQQPTQNSANCDCAADRRQFGLLQAMPNDIPAFISSTI